MSGVFNQDTAEREAHDALVEREQLEAELEAERMTELLVLGDEPVADRINGAGEIDQEIFRREFGDWLDKVLPPPTEEEMNRMTGGQHG